MGRLLIALVMLAAISFAAYIIICAFLRLTQRAIEARRLRAAHEAALLERVDNHLAQLNDLAAHDPLVSDQIRTVRDHIRAKRY